MVVIPEPLLVSEKGVRSRLSRHQTDGRQRPCNDETHFSPVYRGGKDLRVLYGRVKITPMSVPLFVTFPTEVHV